MQIDPVSENILTIALFLEKSTPGLATELWVTDEIKRRVQTNVDAIKTPKKLIESTKSLIDNLTDSRRKQYLEEVLNSLVYQLNKNNLTNKYTDFSLATFGFKIERISEAELHTLEAAIHTSEELLGMKRQQVYRRYDLQEKELLPQFAKHIESITNRLPAYLFNFPDEGVSLKTTSGKPWSAFNTHVKPFQSSVILNTDVGLTDLDLYRLASHEICGGHHTELSNKDQMLMELNRGEHGIVVTYSPQTFVSEAIAEVSFEFFGILDTQNFEMMTAWQYDRLTFGLFNLATFLFFDDGLSKKEIDKKLGVYAISDKTRENILNFSCDPLFGRYAPVYHAGYHFLKNLYEKTDQKERLIKTLFSQPCTPKLLLSEFS